MGGAVTEWVGVAAFKEGRGLVLFGGCCNSGTSPCLEDLVSLVTLLPIASLPAVVVRS